MSVPQVFIMTGIVKKYLCMYLTIVSKEKQTRKRREPAKLQDYARSHRTGAESENNASSTIEYWRTTVYLRIIDGIIMNLEKRFSEESLELAESVDHFFNLDEHNSLCFINTYKVHI